VWFTIIFWAFVYWTVWQVGYVIYYNYYFLKPSNATTTKGQLQTVSVVICAKNELHNLKEYLPSTLNQKYAQASGLPNFEVVVVNDASNDGTYEWLNNLSDQYGHLRVIHISPDANRSFKGKKHALSEALKTIENDWLLLTDADCKPASDQWLQLMVQPLSIGKEIVAGYGAYMKEDGLMNAFIRWETLQSFWQGYTYAAVGMPYWALGRNMACTKKILEQAQKTADWHTSPSGDDDLLVKTGSNKRNYALVSQSEAYTYTAAPHDLKSWIKQKQRHLTDGKQYKLYTKLLLAIYGFTHAAMWLYFLALMLSPYWVYALAIMGIRCLIFWKFNYSAAHKMKEQLPIGGLPLFDFGWMLFNFGFLPYILIKNKQEWT